MSRAYSALRSGPARVAVLLAVIAAIQFVSSGAPPHWATGPAHLAGPGLAVAAEPPAAAPKGMQYVTSVEGIHEYVMDNGLKVLLFPDPSKRTTTVAITYLVGSGHENYGETGMAHLLEHLVFKGSTNHPNIPDELTSHGARPNGSTWYDRTNYFETFTSTEENLSWALDLEADRMVNSFISAEDLESEMTVVRNEFEIGENNPAGVLEERIMSTAYLWHNYGNTTIGSRSDIEGVPIERLQAFYRTWYQPDNAILVVAGSFDAEFALNEVKKTFGKIPRPERNLPTTYTIEPAQDGERTVTLRRVGDYQMVGVAYHIPAGSHADFAPMEMLAEILGDEPSGRLYKALVETRKATSVSTWAMQFRDPSVIYASARVRKDRPIEEARDEMIRVIEGVATEPPTVEELERARRSLLRGWEQSMRNSQWAAIGLSEWAAMGDWRLMFLHRDRLREVTAEDVQRVAAGYLKTNNRTVGVYLPSETAERVEIPANPDIQMLLGGYTGGDAMAMGEEFDPAPASIEGKVIRSTLPNGLKLVLLPKKTRGETVNISLRTRHGDESSLQGRAVAADLAGSMLMRGTATHTRQEIRDELDRLQTRLYVGGGATSAYAGGETTREHLDALLRLTAEILREPSFPENEFTQLREERLLSLEQSKTEPRAQANIAIQRHMNPWPQEDPRYTRTTEEEVASLQAMTLDEVRAFHREFYGASHGELAIVGDFDPEAIGALVTELFGGWTTPGPYARLEDGYREIPPLHESIETPDKESATFRASLRINVRDDDPDYPALSLAAFMTGGGFLNSRLATRIRQQDGLSYSVGGWFYADAFEKDGWFSAFAMYAPQNRDALERAFREEIEKIVQDGFTEEEINEAKSGFLQREEMGRSMDRSLASTLAERAYEERDLTWDAAFEERIALLSPEEIHEAVKRHIDPAKISVVHAGDFAKVKEERTSLD